VIILTPDELWTGKPSPNLFYKLTTLVVT